MPSPNSLHDLWLYQQSPRAWAIRKMGYTPYEKPGPAVAGTICHTAIAAWYKGQDVEAAVNGYLDRLQDKMEVQGTLDDHYDELVKNEKAGTDAAVRYMSLVEGQYKPLAIESTLVTADGYVRGTPDAIVQSDVGIEILDFKTSGRPNYEALKWSGQLDLYAVLAGEVVGYEIERVAYYVISPETVWPLVYKPTWWLGESLFSDIQALSAVKLEWALRQNWTGYHARQTGYEGAEDAYYWSNGCIETMVDWLNNNMVYEEPDKETMDELQDVINEERGNS